MNRPWSRKHVHDRRILAFALPALATLASDPLVTIIDTAFVGRLGTTALGALGVNGGIFALAFVAFNFLSYGTTPLVANAVGEGRRVDAGRLVVAALLLAVVLGAVATGALFLAGSQMVDWMGAKGDLVAPTMDYLVVRAWAAPAVLLVTAGNGAFRGYGDARTPLLVTLVLNAVNIVLDPLFIFGFGWGIVGAAWATVIAQWVGALGFVALLLGSRRTALGIEWALPGVAPFRRLLGVGSILSVRTVALIFTMTATTSLATRFGETTIAAHQVAIQLWVMFAFCIDGFAIAGQTLVAEERGAGRFRTAREISDRLLFWGLWTGSVLGVGVWAAAPLWPQLFALEPEVRVLLSRVLPIVAVMQPLNAFVFVWDGTFIGEERFGFLAASMLCACALTLGALVLVWVGDGGLVGIWWAMVVLIVIRGAAQAMAYFGTGGRQNPLT